MSLFNCKLTEVNKQLPENLDLFITSASYESRCRCIADHLDVKRVKQSVVTQNLKPSAPLILNAKYLAHKLSSGKPIELDKNNPLFGADNIYSKLSEIFQSGPKTILVDVTTFTHEATFIVVQLIKLLARETDDVLFSYVGVEEYSPGLPDAEKWLSKGIREIRSVLGFPGELLPSRKIHLIVMVGHETERARALIDAYEPSLLSLGYSTKGSSISEKNFEANQHFHSQMRSLFPKNEEFSFSANDILESKHAVELLISKFPEYNTVIAPMNSKLSAIGVALAAFDNESIQVCYAQPEIYNYENFSTPKDTCFLFRIDGIGLNRQSWKK